MVVLSAVAVHRTVAGPLDANCLVVAGDGGDAVVVDPGGDAAQIAAVVAGNRLRVHAVLATHGHYDHVSAAAEVVELYGVPFGIHSGDHDALRRVNFHRYAIHGLGPVEVPTSELDLATVGRLRFGELEIAVLQTPGHTPGSVCFGVAGALLTGDTLMATGLASTDLHGCDTAKLEASVRLLARDFPPDTVLHPGHGGPCRLADAAGNALATAETA